jgi:hypothetical protein
MSSLFVLQVFYKDGSLINNNSVTFPDWSFVYGENSVFMPTWLSKYSKDSEGNRFLHNRVSVRVRVRERVRVLSCLVCERVHTRATPQRRQHQCFLGWFVAGVRNVAER